MTVLVALLAASAAVLVYARVGAIHGPVTRLFLTTSRARGVIAGTDVWLDGERVGRVAWIRFRSPSVDTTQRLLIALDLRSSIAPFVRRDTRAEIRPGASLIGAPVVSLSGGSADAPSVVANDTLATFPQGDLDGVRAQLVVATQDLPAIRGNIDSVRHRLFSTSGTIGALSGEDGVRRLAVLTDRAARLSARSSTAGGGSVGALARLASGGGDLAARVERTLALARAVEREATGPRTLWSRVMGDSQLVRDIRDVQAQVADVQSRLAASAGGDSSVAGGSDPLPGVRLARLQAQLAGVGTQLRALAADVGHRPFRYLTF